MPYPNELAPLTVTQGAMRFNTDSMKLEYYRGGPVGFGTTTQTGEWVNITTDSPDIQTGGARGVFSGESFVPAASNVIQYITISSTGNAIDFGDRSNTVYGPGSLASSTRGLWAGGYRGGFTNTIDYVTISSTGNAISFGNLTLARIGASGCSNATRGLFGGGNGVPAGNNTNIIDYVTIASTGNAVDFGDILAATNGDNHTAAFSSATRGIWSGGATPTLQNVIQFVTILTTGNTSDFGDLTVARQGVVGCSNATRGLSAGGYDNTIDYITIATLGNAIDFGDLTSARGRFGGTSSPTRGVFAGGALQASPGGTVNIIDYVTIVSTGNAIDFGDMLVASGYATGCSNGHGGLG